MPDIPLGHPFGKFERGDERRRSHPHAAIFGAVSPRATASVLLAWVNMTLFQLIAGEVELRSTASLPVTPTGRS